MAEIKTVELQIKSNVNTASQEFDSFAKSIKAVDNSATNLDATFEEVYGDLKPLTTRMGEAEDRLYELALAGKQGTQEFKDLLTSVGNYRKTQIQTDMVVDAAATTLGQKLTGSLNAAAGAFSLVQGSMSLFGAESEDVEQAILKVQSAMAISQGVETITEGAKSVRALGTAIQSTTVFQKASSAAQYVWNAAMAANPIGVVVASIAALLIGGYKLIKFFKDSSDANEKATKAAEHNTKALKNQSLQASQSSTKLQTYNDHQYNLAKAAGASSEELRKLALKHKEEEVALNKKNAVLARATFLRERDTLAALKASDASDDVIAKQEELTKSSYDFFKKQNEILSNSYKERAALRRSQEVEVVAERKAAKDKAIEDAKEAKEKAKEDANDAREKAKEERIAAQKEADEEKQKLAREQGEKFREDLENAEKLAKEIKQKNIDATKTENQLKVEAENAEFERKKALLVAANLSTEELDKLHKENLYKLELEYWAKQSDASVAATAKEKELSEARKKIAEEEKVAKMKLLQEISAGLSLAADELGQSTVAGKAAAVASATINTYAAIAGQLKAFSGVPIPGYAIAQAIVTGAAGLLQVKKILSVQVPSGGGNSGSAPSVGGISAPSAPPSFNVVGTSGQNQIAQSLGNQAPVKAYVVSNDVTTAQSLDRNIVKTATVG